MHDEIGSVSYNFLVETRYKDQNTWDIAICEFCRKRSSFFEICTGVALVVGGISGFVAHRFVPSISQQEKPILASIIVGVVIAAIFLTIVCLVCWILFPGVRRHFVRWLPELDEHALQDRAIEKHKQKTGFQESRWNVRLLPPGVWTEFYRGYFKDTEWKTSTHEQE